MKLPCTYSLTVGGLGILGEARHRARFYSLYLVNTSEWIWFCFSIMNAEELILFCYGARTIWYNRNLIYHGKSGLKVEESCLSTRALTNSYSRPSCKFTISALDGSCLWTPPKKPDVKVNCDGACEESSVLAGISGICREEEGTIMGIMTEHIKAIRTVLEAEGLQNQCIPC
ncbi:hypothetical protein QQ045_007476 [Rhodiola kirilowii]